MLDVLEHEKDTLLARSTALYTMPYVPSPIRPTFSNADTWRHEPIDDEDADRAMCATDVPPARPARLSEPPSNNDNNERSIKDGRGTREIGGVR